MDEKVIFKTLKVDADDDYRMVLWKGEKASFFRWRIARRAFNSCPGMTELFNLADFRDLRDEVKTVSDMKRWQETQKEKDGQAKEWLQASWKEAEKREK